MASVWLAAGMAAVILAGCASVAERPAGDFNVYNAPSLPAVAMPGVKSDGREDVCSPASVAQAQKLRRGLARLRTGQSIDMVTRILGEPATAKAMAARDAGQVEVLFYHTPSTICRGADTSLELVPVVFRGQRLTGTGEAHYRDFVAPRP